MLTSWSCLHSQPDSSSYLRSCSMQPPLPTSPWAPIPLNISYTHSNQCMQTQSSSKCKFGYISSTCHLVIFKFWSNRRLGTFVRLNLFSFPHNWNPHHYMQLFRPLLNWLFLGALCVQLCTKRIISNLSLFDSSTFRLIYLQLPSRPTTLQISRFVLNIIWMADDMDGNSERFISSLWWRPSKLH